jgi:polygalacturonase
VYDFQETVVIPAGVMLTIEPGAVLRFGAGRSLVAYGPVQARGTAAVPIQFTARRKWLKWGAVVVVSSGRSVFEHVRFEHGRWALLDQIEFPGTLSIYGGDVEISNSIFQQTYGKDAVNVREANAVIRNNLVRDAHKDGLDFDGGRGMVFGNVFVDCGDEGIDLAGDYDLQVFDNQIFDSSGGRVEADQGRDVILERNVFGYSQAD